MIGIANARRHVSCWVISTTGRLKDIGIYRSPIDDGIAEIARRRARLQRSERPRSTANPSIRTGHHQQDTRHNETRMHAEIDLGSLRRPQSGLLCPDRQHAAKHFFSQRSSAGFLSFVKVDGLDIFIASGAAKEPTLRHLTRLSSSSRKFEPLLARLRAIHLLAPDYRAFGNSTRRS